MEAIRFVVACDHAMIDQANKLSAIGVFDRVSLKDGQAPLNFTIAGKFQVLESEAVPAEATIQIFDSSNEPVGEALSLGTASATSGGSLNVIAKLNITVLSLGDHSVSLTHGGDELYRGRIFTAVPADEI